MCKTRGNKKHVSAYREYSFEDKAFLDICLILPNARPQTKWYTIKMYNFWVQFSWPFLWCDSFCCKFFCVPLCLRFIRPFGRCVVAYPYMFLKQMAFYLKHELPRCITIRRADHIFCMSLCGP